MTLHDGPGIRSTVFLSGCPLRCIWCHNPESWEMESTRSEWPGPAKGEIEVEEAVGELLKDRILYQISGGGVTCSGGEPLLQPYALAELLKRLKKEGIHTAVDTAGEVPFAAFEQVMPYTDLFLYDLKLMDAVKHQKYTGASNERILKNFIRMEKEKPVIVRIPSIAGIQEAEYQKMAEFLCGKKNVKLVEMLPYHGLGERKYSALNRNIPPLRPVENAELEKAAEYFKNAGIEVHWTGEDC